MPSAPTRRPRIGDVIEIPTPNGLAYAHFTHKHPKYGALLRVLPSVHGARPSCFSALVAQHPQFTAFFALGAACSRGIVCVVGHEPLPSHTREFPIFRSCVRTPSGSGPWWLWDGNEEWKVGELAPGMEQLPIRGIWNDTLLIERIVAGWRHEHDT